ncbi:competence type IV pilus minor pilin ComGF [Eremococcus coleocola]|uniref:competence type IV pilus minor pilin ComGF n=1 Tax=Eremococcus coleocola TaxID=88132 RepID=UPI000413BF8E|nr:competence type IV pilus minor pilin ComGF [Eremococcus coleocola]
MKAQTKAFTLIESLFVLFIASLILYSLQSVLLVYRQEVNRVQADHYLDFHQFLVLLENELKRYDQVQVESKQIIVKSNEAETFYLQAYQNQLIKRPGYHPLLLEVADFTFFEFSSGLYVWVEFDNGQKFTGFIPLKLSVQKVGSADEIS